MPGLANIPDKLYHIYDKYNINVLYLSSYSEESKGDDEGIPFGKVKNLERGYDELLKEIYSSDAYKRERPGLHNATKKNAPIKTAKQHMGIPRQYDWNRTLDDMESGEPRKIVRNKKPIIPTQFPLEIYGITAPIDLAAGPIDLEAGPIGSEAGLKLYDFSNRDKNYDPENAGLGGKATRKANKHRKSHKSKKARKSRKVRKSKKSRKTRK